MTQTSTHSYDCTGFRSICFYCGSWNWSIRLSSDGFFSLYDAKCQLQKEILTPWKPHVPLTWNAGLFWVNWLFLIIKGIKGKSPYIVSPKLAIRLKKTQSNLHVSRDLRLISLCPQSRLGSQWGPMASVYEIHRGLDRQRCSMKGSESLAAILLLRPSSSSVSPWGEAQHTVQKWEL